MKIIFHGSSHFWLKQAVTNIYLIKILYSFDKLFIESDERSVKHH
jgi:hypothetical protein